MSIYWLYTTHMCNWTFRLFFKDESNQIDDSLFPVLKFRATASKAEFFTAYENHEVSAYIINNFKSFFETSKEFKWKLKL